MVGTPVLITASELNGPEGLDYAAYANYLKSADAVEDFAYSSARLGDSVGTSIVLSNLGRIKAFGSNIYGVSPNFFSVFPSKFFQFSSPLSYPIDYNQIGQRLYSTTDDDGSVLMAIGTYYAQEMNIQSQSDNFLLQVSFSGTNLSRSVRLKASYSVLLDRAPVFKFSAYPSTTGPQDAFVSLPTMITIASTAVYPNISSIPITRIFLKVMRSIMLCYYITHNKLLV